MHKFIARFFSGILSVIHLTFFAGLILLYLNSEAFLVNGPETTTRLLLITAGVGLAYILFAGLTSVLIRINQNLETLVRLSKEQSIYEDELSESDS